MNQAKKIIMITALTILLSLLVMGLTQSNPVSTNTVKVIKWEYKVFTNEDELILSMKRENRIDTVRKFEKNINLLGEQGWELFFIGEDVTFFKRPKQAQ